MKISRPSLWRRLLTLSLTPLLSRIMSSTLIPSLRGCWLLFQIQLSCPDILPTFMVTSFGGLTLLITITHIITSPTTLHLLHNNITSLTTILQLLHRNITIPMSHALISLSPTPRLAPGITPPTLISLWPPPCSTGPAPRPLRPLSPTSPSPGSSSPASSTSTGILSTHDYLYDRI